MVVNSDLTMNRQDLYIYPSPGHHPAGLRVVLALSEAFLVVKLLHLKFLDSVSIVDVGEVLKIRIAIPGYSVKRHFTIEIFSKISMHFTFSKQNKRGVKFTSNELISKKYIE